MRIGLFIPCYVDQFYPRVAIATLQLLEKLNLSVTYPLNQTCCGQPMANSGFESFGAGAADVFTENFQEFDYVVAPSGSCVLHVKEHMGKAGDAFHGRIFELSEFLTDVVKVKNLNASFTHRVGLHASCHGQRGLRLASASELHEPRYNKTKSLLQMVEGIDLAELTRTDECCGFGGTFAVSEEALSVKMGKDRIKDHLSHDVEVITSADMSCLMHMEGLLKRQKSKVKVMHVAEILNHSK